MLKACALMQKVLFVLVSAAALLNKRNPGEDIVDACGDVKCGALECKPPFVYKTPEEAGTCCATCESDKVVVPEDRSWAAGLTGGVGADPNADQTLCRGVVCLKPDCPEFEQVFSGRCCTTCKAQKALTSATDSRDAIEEAVA